MQRRNFLKAAGGLAALTAVGGAALTGGATATSNQSYGDVTISSDDGSVEYVAIYGDSVVTWDGFDTEATQFSIAIEAKLGSESTWTQLHDTGLVDLSNANWGNYDESLSGPGTSGTIESGIGLAEDGTHDPTIDWHVVGTDPDGYGLPQNNISASKLSVDSDGTTETYVVEIRSTYTWYDAGDAEIHSETFTSTVDVTVTNEATTASTSDGSGDDGATGA